MNNIIIPLLLFINYSQFQNLTIIYIIPHQIWNFTTGHCLPTIHQAYILEDFFLNLLWEEILKQWWSTIQQISTKWTITSQGLVFGQAQQCGGINPVNGIPMYAFQLNKSVLS